MLNRRHEHVISALVDLSHRLERTRNRLHRVIDETGGNLTSPEVVEASAEFDALHSSFMRHMMHHRYAMSELLVERDELSPVTAQWKSRKSRPCGHVARVDSCSRRLPWGLRGDL